MLLSGTLLRAGTSAPGWLELRGDRIAAAGEGPAPTGAEEQDGAIAPGLFDLQVNGAAGVNVTEGRDALERIDAAMLDHGVTSYLATIITTSEEEAARTVADAAPRLDDPASPLEGVHLEGPFLSPARRGVHRVEHLRVPADGVPAHFADPAVRLVTLAPEL